MIRFLASVTLRLLANAVGLLVAALLLDGFTVDALSFVVVVVVFTLVELFLDPLITKISLKYVSALRGGVALATTLVGLIVATLVGDGLQISGLSTWIAGTVIVWLGGVLAAVILPLFLFKKAMGRRQSSGA